MKTGKDGMKGVREDEEKVEGRCGMKTGKEGMKEVRSEGKCKMKTGKDGMKGVRDQCEEVRDDEE